MMILSEVAETQSHDNPYMRFATSGTLLLLCGVDESTQKCVSTLTPEGAACTYGVHFCSKKQRILHFLEAWPIYGHGPYAGIPGVCKGEARPPMSRLVFYVHTWQTLCSACRPHVSHTQFLAPGVQYWWYTSGTATND